MTPEKRIQDLEHQVDLLTSKLQIAELSAEIYRKKLERYKATHPETEEKIWKVETPNTTAYVGNAQVRDLTERIAQAMKRSKP